jgi:nucleoside-diphosphate-sugar epimerase
MNILITGGAGYIGSELTQYLLDEGHAVTCYDNLMYDPASLLRYTTNERFTFVKGDVRNYRKLKEHLKKADIIIPLAALIGFPLCRDNPKDAQDINRLANWFIAGTKSNEQRVIYPCTNSGYGVGESGKYCTEESPLKPISLYGQTKVAAEREYQNVDNHVTFRLATVFGPSSRMRTDLLVNNFVLKALREKLIVLYECEFMRNYIHLHDVCRAFMFVINNWESCKNQTYNAGNDEINMNKLDLSKKIQKQVSLEIIFAEFTQDLDKRDYIVSSQKFYNKGFACKYDLDIGIKQLLSAYSIIEEPWYANY